MKTNYFLVVLTVLLIFVHSVTGQTLSVKGRWNVKAGFSMYKLSSTTDRLFEFDWDKSDMMYKRKLNVRAEVNYGMLKWLETGVYIGLLSYEYSVINMSDPLNIKDKTAVGPTFGVNVNVHILPFFVKNPNCHWDFYVPLKYGGNYISKIDRIGFAPIGTWDDATAKLPLQEAMYKYTATLCGSKFQPEYGAGLGAAVYIKNIIGFYIEAMGGQFSYYSLLVKSPYDIRIGLTAKF